MFSYSTKIISIYDGDTLDAEVDLGFNLKFKIKLRLFGINCPEMRGKEKSKGIQSRDWLRGEILDKVVQLDTIRDKQGKYGRYLAIIYYNGVNINNELVKQKLAEFKEY